MLLEIVIVVCVAFAAAGVVMLVSKLVRRKTSKTLALVAAGVAMFSYVQWERYSWADRYAAALPPTSQVVMALPYDGWIEPWARLVPRNDKLLVVDRTTVMRNADFPHLLVATTMLVERNQETLSLLQFIDCVQRRRAPVLGEVSFKESGLPKTEDWIDGGQPAALYDAACAAR